MKKTIILTKPVVIDDKEIKEINFDFGSMTGADILRIDAEMEVTGQGHVGTDSTHFNAHCAAKAANMHVDDLSLLSARDYMTAIFTARNFMVGFWGTEAEEEQKTSDDSSGILEKQTEE